MDIGSITTTLFTSAVTGIAGYLFAMLGKHGKALHAALKVVKATARKEVMDAYQLYVAEGRRMTVERFDQITEIYGAYKALGGNGTAARMYGEIKAKRPWIVTD